MPLNQGNTILRSLILGLFICQICVHI